MTDLAPIYRQTGTCDLESGQAQVWSGEGLSDPEWDQFLQGTPMGHFQQSSPWAEYKATEGWHSHRTLVKAESGIVGGYQCLWKRVGLARIGYVVKGPVSRAGDPAITRQLGSLLIRDSKRLGLTLLVAQQPDDVARDATDLDSLGFFRSNPAPVVQATCNIHTHDGLDAIRSRMNKTTRYQVSRAQKKGVTIREGTEADLPVFFELMLGSCRRQEARPNPATVEALQKIWTSFSRLRATRVTFAICEGKVTAGALCLRFGKRLSLWKKGWNSEFREMYPNDLIYFEICQWAASQGLDLVDHCAFDELAAIEMKKKGSSEGISLRSRDVFILRFGGVPQLLPKSMVYLPNPFVRFAYRCFYLPRERRRQKAAAAIALAAMYQPPGSKPDA